MLLFLFGIFFLPLEGSLRSQQDNNQVLNTVSNINYELAANKPSLMEYHRHFSDVKKRHNAGQPMLFFFGDFIVQMVNGNEI